MYERTRKLQKQWILRRLAVLLGSMVLLVVLVAVYLNMSLGWFSSNKDVSGTGMNVGVDYSLFELAVSGGQITPYADDAPIVTYLSSNENIQKLSATTPANSALLCHMTNENPHIDHSEFIAPGSFGTVSFDIVLKKEYDGAFTIDLDFLFYGTDMSRNPVPVDAEEEELLQLRNLLSGHILFFETRSETLDNGGYYYSDRITDGQFVYDLSEHEDDRNVQNGEEHYTVTFYWIWPATFGRLALSTTSDNLHGHALFEDEDDRAEILSQIQNHPECFFVNLRDRVDLTVSEFEEMEFADLSDGYNEGDQFIGDRVRFLVLESEIIPG